LALKAFGVVALLYIKPSTKIKYLLISA